jgi:hypothetical protein
MSRPSINHLPTINSKFIEEVIRAAKPYVAGADISWVRQQEHKFPFSVYFCLSGNVPPRYELKFKQVFDSIKEKYERNDKIFH